MLKPELFSLVSFALCLAAAAQASSPRRFAIPVGINQYADPGFPQTLKLPFRATSLRVQPADSRYKKRAPPVGQKTSNSLGLYDMGGNVRQWCRD